MNLQGPGSGGGGTRAKGPVGTSGTNEPKAGPDDRTAGPDDETGDETLGPDDESGG